MEQKHHQGRLLSLLIILFLLAWSGPVITSLKGLAAQLPGPAAPAAADQSIVARIYFTNDQNLAALSSHFQVLETHDDYLLAVLTPEQWSSLKNSGLRIEIEQTRKP